jgi:hypothetical protein
MRRVLVAAPAAFLLTAVGALAARIDLGQVLNIPQAFWSNLLVIGATADGSVAIDGGTHEPRGPPPPDRSPRDSRVLQPRERGRPGGRDPRGHDVPRRVGGTYVANRLQGPHLRLAFGVFLSGLGVYLVYGACRRLGWV